MKHFEKVHLPSLVIFLVMLRVAMMMNKQQQQQHFEHLLSQLE